MSTSAFQQGTIEKNKLRGKWRQKKEVRVGKGYNIRNPSAPCFSKEMDRGRDRKEEEEEEEEANFKLFDHGFDFSSAEMH